MRHVDAPGIATLLRPFRERLRLVVLCVCHSGDARPEALFLGSLAQAIHREGVPAVVASRYPLSGSGSVRLTWVLYKAMLGEGTSLERALRQVRVALHSPGGRAGPDEGGDEPGRLSEDAYALQFYARSVEEVRAADGTPAHRKVTATYPFGGGRAERRKKAPFHVPFFKNEGFVGREGDLEKLHALLQQGEAVGVRPAASGAHPAALTGMGGIGKAQLAVEYAYRHRDAYPGGVYWVNAAQRWQAELASLAEKLGLRDDSATEADRERRLALAFGRYLDEHPGALVIFDNVEDPLALREPTPDLIPARLPCRLLFTTRRRWLLAASMLFNDHGEMGDVLVITASRSVARWAARVASARGALGTGLELRPKVLLLAGRTLQALLDPRRPELAFFAAWPCSIGMAPRRGRPSGARSSSPGS